MGVHLAAFALATVLDAPVVLRAVDRRASIVVALAWSTFASPYAYDYDMAIPVVVAALVADAFVRVVGHEFSANLLAAVLLAQFAGFVWWTFDGIGGISAYVNVGLYAALLVVVIRDGGGVVAVPSPRPVDARSTDGDHDAGRA